MKCPICRKTVLEPTPAAPNSAYPFCSDRCRDIDLGRWLDEKYQIPVAQSDDDGATSELSEDSESQNHA